MLFCKIVAVDTGEMVLIRHGQTPFNINHIYSGRLMHIDLTPDGVCKSVEAGGRCAQYGFRPDEIHEAPPLRVIRTTDGVIEGAGWDPSIPRIQAPALIERCYGRFTGHQRPVAGSLPYNEYLKFHRNPYGRPPGGQNEYGTFDGESLLMCRERIAPYFREILLPQLLAGRNILAVLHGNSLRALTWEVDRLTDDQIEALEIPWAEPIGYRFHPNGSAKESFLIQGVMIESLDGSWWLGRLRGITNGPPILRSKTEPL